MDGIPFIVPPHTTQYISLQSLYHELNELSGQETASVDSEHISTARQIELCSRLICQGVKSPFPNTRRDLALILQSIKRFLLQLSLAELIAVSNFDHADDPIEVLQDEALEKLMNHPAARQHFPTLKKALHYIHSADCLEIYAILYSKLHQSAWNIRTSL